MDKAIRETIGLDLGDRTSSFCVLSQGGGQILGQGQVATTPTALGRFLAGWPGARVVVEVGSHSPWVSRLAQERCAQALVANARDLHFIFRNRRKSDEVDAEALARVGRLDPQLLSPLEHRGEAAQRALAVVRARRALVQARTQLVNAMRGMIKPFGHRLPKQAAKSLGSRTLARVPAELRATFEPLLGAVEDLTQRIRAYDRQIVAWAEARKEESRRLTQVDGVGDLTAMAYMLTLEDPARLRTSRDAGPFFGLVPRRDQSGESDRQLGITKTGDRLVRALLVQSAHRILGPFGPDSTLKRHGLALAARGGAAAKKRAVIAVARKLAVLLHRLWITGEAYEPLRLKPTA